MKKFYYLFILILFIGCTDDDVTPKVEPEPNENGMVAENVVVISKDDSELISTEADLAGGIYIIQFSGEIPEFEEKDIIVGDEGEGYLRQVNSITREGNTVTFKTIQANLEQVFNNATLNFSTDLGSMQGQMISESYKLKYAAEGVKVVQDGMHLNFNNTVLFEQGAHKFIINGNAKFQPNLSFSSDYKFFSLETVEFKTDNLNLSLDCDLIWEAESAVQIPVFEKQLAKFQRIITFSVGIIPVVVTVDIEMVARMSAGAEFSFNAKTGFTQQFQDPLI